MLPCAPRREARFLPMWQALVAAPGKSFRTVSRTLSKRTWDAGSSGCAAERAHGFPGVRVRNFMHSLFTAAYDMSSECSASCFRNPAAGVERTEGVRRRWLPVYNPSCCLLCGLRRLVPAVGNGRLHLSTVSSADMRNVWRRSVVFSVYVRSSSAKSVLLPLGPVLPRLVPRRKTETAVRWFVVVRQRLPLWQVCFLPSLVLQRRVRRKAESAKRMACFPFDPGLSRANGLLLSASVFRRLLCLVGLCLPKVKRFMLIRMPPCEAPSSGFPRCSVNCVSSVHRVSGEVPARYAAGHPASERRRDVIV